MHFPNGHRFPRRFGRGQVIIGNELPGGTSECVYQARLQTAIDGRVQALMVALRTPRYDPVRLETVAPARARLEQQARVLAEALPRSSGALPGIVEVGRTPAPERNRNTGGLLAEPEPYLITEWPRGWPLTDIGFRFSASDAAALVLGLGIAVQALHACGWVHTELWPSNVAIDIDVLRLGIRSMANVERVGAAGVTRASGPFSAPELAGGCKIDPRIDVFSLGRLLQRLLCGNNGTNHRSTDDIPDNLASVLESATSVRPHERFVNAGSFVAAVAEAMDWKPAKRRSVGKQVSIQHQEFILKNPLPKSIGPYKVEDILSLGGEAAVLLATAPPPDANLPAIPVVIKAILYDKQVKNRERDDWGRAIDDARGQLAEEARTLCKVKRYTDVPLFIDFLKTETFDKAIIRALVPAGIHNEPFLVMQDLRKLPLSDFTPRSLSVNCVYRISYAICRSMASMHHRGLAYKDLKPDNVLVDAHGVLVHLVDFGATTPMIANGVLDQESPCWTAHTPGFAAPEFILGDGICDGRRFDVYSIGALMWWALSGRDPRKLVEKADCDALQKYQAKVITIDEFEDRRRRAQSIELPLKHLAKYQRSLLSRLLAREREARPESASAVLTLMGSERIRSNGGLMAPPALVEPPHVASGGAALLVKVRSTFNEMITGVRLYRQDTDGPVEVSKVNGWSPSKKLDGLRLGEFVLVDRRPRAGFATYAVEHIASDGIVPDSCSFEIAIPLPPTLDSIPGPGYVELVWKLPVSTIDALELRRGETPPRNRIEGELLGRVDPTAARFLDRDTEPGVQHGYSAFALYCSPSRATAVSEPGTAVAAALAEPETPVFSPANPAHSPVLRWRTQSPPAERYAVRWTSFDGQRSIGTAEVAGSGGPEVVFEPEIVPGAWAQVFVCAKVREARSDEARRIVCGRDTLKDATAIPRLGAVEVRWAQWAGVDYQIRFADSSEAEHATGGRFLAAREPGHYTVQLIALARRPESGSARTVEIGRRTIEAVALEAVPTPLPDVLVSRRCVKIRWTWLAGDAPLRQVDAVEVRLLDGSDALWQQTVSAPTCVVVSPPMPVGRCLELQLQGLCGDERSEEPFVTNVVPTSPVESLKVAALLGRAVLTWRMPSGARSARVERIGRLGTEHVGDAKEGHFEDVPPRFATPFRWRVTPIFAQGVGGDSSETPDARITRMPGPPKLEARGSEDEVVIRWSGGPGSEIVTAWRVLVRGAGVAVDRVVPKARLSFRTNVSPWEPIEVGVVPKVGDEEALSAVEHVFATRALRISVKLPDSPVGPTSVALKWPAEPKFGFVDVRRSDGDGQMTNVGAGRLRDGMWIDSDIERDQKYRYQFRQRRRKGTVDMEGGWEAVLDAWPRSAPPEPLPVAIRLGEAGRMAHISCAAVGSHPGIDEALVVRLQAEGIFTPDPWPRSAFERELQSKRIKVVAREPVATGDEVPDRETRDRIGEEGRRYIYSEVLANSSFVTIGSPVNVSPVFEAPPAAVNWSSLGITFSPNWENAPPGGIVVIRRRVDEAGESCPLPSVLPGATRTAALVEAAKALGGNDSLTLVSSGAESSDLYFHLQPGRWSYTAHRLVKSKDESQTWLLSPGTLWHQGEVARPLVLYEVRRTGLFFRLRLFWWVADHAASGICLTYNDSGAEEILNIEDTSGALAVTTPQAAVTSAKLGGMLLPVHATAGLLAKSKIGIARRLAGRNARSWCNANASMVQQQLADAWGEDIPMKGPSRTGRWRFSIPWIKGGSWLELRPVVKNGDARVQFRRRAWLFFSRPIVELVCSEQTWLRPDHPAWETITNPEGSQ